MRNRIDKYQFSGDWKFNLKLPLLSKIYSEFWFTNHKRLDHLGLLKEGYVPVEILAERNYEPDPMVSQSKTVEFLQVDEMKVVETIYKAFQKKINPQYIEWGGDDWLPKFRTKEDLSLLLCINSITILPYEKKELAYIQFDFEYIGDREHGISIILENDRLLSFCGLGDIDYSSIYEDLSLDKEDINLQDRFGSNQVHKPLAKYNKFKPWQLRVTCEYFEQMLRKQQNEELIKEIISNNWNLNINFCDDEYNLADAAAYFHNPEVLLYLIEKNIDISNSLRYSMLLKGLNKDIVRLLVKNNQSVDINIGHFGLTPLGEEIKKCSTAYRKTVDSKGMGSEITSKFISAYNEHIETIRFYLSVGANPNRVGNNGEDYIKMLKNHWHIGYLRQYEIIPKMKEIVNGGKYNVDKN